MLTAESRESSSTAACAYGREKMRLFLAFVVVFGATDAFVLSTWPKMPSFMMNLSNMLTSSAQSEAPANENNNCPGCAQNKIVIDHDPFLTELRVEYVKQQILKKLRLSKPPEVSMPLSTLPKPLINGNVLELRPGAPLVPDKPAESFYGKTDQVVVFPHEGKILQIQINNGVCGTFGWQPPLSLSLLLSCSLSSELRTLPSTDQKIESFSYTRTRSIRGRTGQQKNTKIAGS